MTASPRPRPWLRTKRPTPFAEGWRWPAEWERHEGTWIAWPHEPTTWGRDPVEVEDAFTRFAWAVAQGETVHVLVRDAAMEARVSGRLEAAGAKRFACHRLKTIDGWIRDYGPVVLVKGRGKRRERLALDFAFDAWGGKYLDLALDTNVPARLVRRHGLERRKVDLVFEGGSVDGNGRGTILTTEQCLLNPNRNVDLSQAEIEGNLRETLGARHVLWLGEGIAGDDTDGHVDDVARFVGPRTVVAARERDPTDENYLALEDNWMRLQAMADQDGRPLEVIALPMPPPVLDGEGERLPASYANFYAANRVVVVPIFGHGTDAKALRVLRRCFPKREVVGICAEKVVEGLGAFHCLSQQLPA